MLKEDKLSHYLETYKIEWSNSLPENCPPENILVPEDEEFYRLLKNPDCVVEDDWKTYVELYPDKKYFGQDLIIANGLSITKNDNFQEAMVLPNLRKFKGIARFKLNPSDGVLLKTGKNVNHYTWWRTTSFDTNSVEIVDHEKA